MGKAAGLGKRKRSSEDVHLEEETTSGPADVYFAADEDQSEMEQVATMLAHAEMCLDEGEKCIPLLRAVVHECDRLGKLKEALQEGERPPLKIAEIIESMSEEERTSLKDMELDAKFYRIYGDALFRLSFLETENEPCNLAILEAAIDIYQCAPTENPPSVALASSLERAAVIASLSIKEKKVRVSKWLDLIRTIEHVDTVNVELAKFFEALHILKDMRVSLENFCVEILEKISSLLDNDPSVCFGLVQLANDSLDAMLSRIEEDDLDLNIEIATQVNSIIRLIKSTLQSLDLVKCAQKDPETHTMLLPAISQLYIWSGCWADMQDDADMADIEYTKAVEIWEECSSRYGLEIPEEVLALRA